jgi:hypothetical protein
VACVHLALRRRTEIGSWLAGDLGQALHERWNIKVMN